MCRKRAWRRGRNGLKVDDTLENKFPRASWKTKAEIVSGTRVAWCAAFSGYRFPLYPPASLAQLGGINIVLVRTSWKWKRWGWQLREFLFPIITALSCDSHSRGYCTAEVILWSLLTMPAYWKRDAPSTSHRGDIHVISLYSKNGCDILLSARETAAIILYSRNVCDVSLYIRYETDTRWDIGEEDENCSKNGYIFYIT